MIGSRSTPSIAELGFAADISSAGSDDNGGIARSHDMRRGIIAITLSLFLAVCQDGARRLLITHARERAASTHESIIRYGPAINMPACVCLLYTLFRRRIIAVRFSMGQRNIKAEGCSAAARGADAVLDGQLDVAGAFGHDYGRREAS